MPCWVHRAELQSRRRTARGMQPVRTHCCNFTERMDRVRRCSRSRIRWTALRSICAGSHWARWPQTAQTTDDRGNGGGFDRANGCARNLERTYLFGYSSGGYLALYLARHYPERFIAVSGLAVKYVFDARTVAHWTHLADPERLQTRNPGRVEELIRTHHPQDWLTHLQADE